MIAVKTVRLVNYQTYELGAASTQSHCHQLSNEKNPGCLRYIEDFTAQLLYRDFNKPLHIVIPIKQPVYWKVRGFFSWLTCLN